MPTTAPPDAADADLTTRARDALYTAVGFGVLAAQRLQVRRRGLAKDLNERLTESPPDLGRIVRQVQVAVEPVIDPLLDVVEARLPLAQRVLFRQARRAARPPRPRATAASKPSSTGPGR